MTHYRTNLADVRFNLFEVFRRDLVLGTGPWADIDREAVEDMLSAGAELAETALAASFADDEHGDVDFDPTTHSVRLPPAFHQSYKSYVAAEWWRMDVGPELGGIAVPQSVRWAMSEFPLGANPAVFLYASGWPQAQILHQQGNKAQRRVAELMVERGWGATMVLTEPDAGSAVGAGKTRALPQDDGTWHLAGVKRFITSAEHDLADNIVHLVLARPVDTQGAGGPGTKGLSLFMVPKFHVDLETGELTERNGVQVTNVESKMGLKVSATCELTFGQEEPAVGWLVGDVHDGIAQMFEVVEYARMLVGTKAMATLSTGYLNALDYARTRLQSPDLTRKGDRKAPDIAIIGHPDVRRSLMVQKAYAEGMRALVTFAACNLDDIVLAEHGGLDASALMARNDLLLPIVKGYCSEKAYATLTESLQVFGGSGYLHDYPIEQYIRDAKIDTIYEGTTAIQGIDFFFRKVRRDGGVALGGLLDEVEGWLDAARGHHDVLVDALFRALHAVRRSQLVLTDWAGRSEEDPRALYLVGQHTTRFLMMVGDLVVGWLLARQAEVAAAHLASGDAGARGADFYRGKVMVATFFATERLPLVSTEADMLAAATQHLMEMPDAAF
ncbi:butyryl-CoA dehydrogenase [Nocardioides sp. Soil777]|uniref:acyl-CoA dehydrogenase n=1 Tax=Nocardioides sp. Soil777 TaxID=1736409 RepID=UPI000702CF8B|nr:acyl-CoA dehydrogenase [Nocardioides sp. Soil777]KRF00975.1 butyryl-CoA dehydrogenase [Nocardioides sp. Soil777]